jgi:replicative DNA helicase
MSENVLDLFRKPIAERALLSFAMDDSDKFYDLSSKITTSDFLDSEHSILFAIMESLSKKGFERFDMTAIANEAQNNGVLQDIGGYKYLNTLSMLSKSPENYDQYLKEVLDASTKFRLYKLLNNNITSLVKGADKTSDDLISSFENQLMDLSTLSKAIDEPINIGDDIVGFADSLMGKKVEMTGIPTGYPILDKQIDGLEPGTLFLIGARKKMGKSAFLTNVACHVAFNSSDKHRCPVLYIDTEMPYTQWKSRVVSNISGVKERLIKHGDLTSEQYERVKMAEGLIVKGKLFHKYVPGFNVSKVAALYKKYKIKENIGLMVFDYIKEPGDRDKDRNEYQILGDITSKLKDLSGELNIPAIGAVQLNRGNDVADSDKISRYADIVAFWSDRSKEDVEKTGLDSGNFKLIIRDSRRGGRTDEDGITYKFYKQRLAIREVRIDLQPTNFEHDGVVNFGDTDDADDEDTRLK